MRKGKKKKVWQQANHVYLILMVDKNPSQSNKTLTKIKSKPMAEQYLSRHKSITKYKSQEENWNYIT